VLALGVGMALFVEGEDADDEATQPVAPQPAPGLFGDPLLVDCLSGGESAGELVRAIGDADAQGIVAEVSAQMEELRELEFLRPVSSRFLDGPELRRELEKLIAEELSLREAAVEGEILTLLGAVPPETDLYELARDALGSQVVGLYDPGEEELLVAAAGELGVFELITLAHEVQHALADQSLGLREGLGERGRVDRELAYASVVEGDATLAMQLYALEHIDLGDQLDALGDTVPGQEAFDGLPDYVQRSLLFPYLEGLRLVCARWLAGGWDAVDQLYRRPPAGTHEVLFPERYGTGPPEDPRDPGDPGDGWRLREARELGAAELEWLFLAPGGEPGDALPDTRRLVSAWAGGELELWSRGSERALGIALAEREDSALLCGALGAWYRAARPEAEVLAGDDAVQLEFTEPGQAAALACDGTEARMGLAPDLATASSLAL